MLHRRTLLVMIVFAACWFAFSTSILAVENNSPKPAAKNKPRILLITQSKGYTHDVVNRHGKPRSKVEKTVEGWAKESGLFDVDCSQDVAKDFTKDNLAKYDIVMFYTTGDLPIAKDSLDYFFGDWLKQKGHGFIGVHSATDTFHNYEPYWDMIGGTFNGHPWHAGDTVSIVVHDPDHATMKPWGKEFTIRDEIYQYKHWQPNKVRVLASLDMAKTQKKQPYQVPVAWAKNYGDGRIFYTNLGHNASTWENPHFKESLLNAVRWIRGDAQGSGEPNPEVSAAQQKASEEAAKAK